MNIKTKINLTVVFLVTLFFTACSSPQVAELPNWYVNSQQNNSVYLYGVGIGKDKEEAVSVALSEVIGKSGISIEASTHSTASSTQINQDSSFYKEFKRDIKTRIKRTKITNYKVINQTYNSDYIVQVRVDRQKFIISLKKELRDNKEKYTLKMRQLENQDNLIKLLEYEKMYNISLDMYTSLEMIESLDRCANRATYIAFFKEVDKKYNDVKNNLKVHVNYGGNTYIFQNKLELFLSENGFSLVKNEVVKNLFYIDFKSVNSYEMHDNINNIKYNIQITSLTDKKEKIANNEMEITISNKGANRQAKNLEVSNKFYIKLKSIGIKKLFGLDK